MRDRLIGALLLLAVFLPDTAQAESVVDSAKTLVDDPYYITEGAVTSFRTCLGIANDHRAMKLWDSDDLEIAKAKAVGSRELVAELQKLPHQVKLRIGFGTIYTCAQIAGAWVAEGRPAGRDAHMIDNPDWQDGRRRHGTVVVDLDLGKGSFRRLDDPEDPNKPVVEDQSGVLRGLIEAVPLVRILTSPRLLPPRDFGGVVIRNAEIDGALLFYNVHLELPLAFANVRFRGYHYQKDVFGDDDEEPVLDAAISIVNSRFNDHLQISASEICGSIRLTDSRFAESVSFRRTRQYGINCDPRTAKDAEPTLLVNTSTFMQSLKTVQADFGSADVFASQIQSFVSSRSQFGQSLRVWEAEIGAFQIDCSILAEKVDISYNYIDKDLFVDGSRSRNKFPPNSQTCHDWWQAKLPDDHQTTITIKSNRIGGGLGLENLDGARTAEPIDLTSNRVGNGSVIMLPAVEQPHRPWHGNVILKGSTYEGQITIGRDVIKSDGSESDVGKDVARWGYCGQASEQEEPLAIINLRAARIRTLTWDLPFTCHYRWTGYGLTYDLWEAGDVARASAHIDEWVDHQDILSHWRQTLNRYEPASLTAMSDYLAGKGSYVDSRSILLEAKRLNYVPDCKPDSWLLPCAGTMVAGLWTSSALAQSADGAAAQDGVAPETFDGTPGLAFWQPFVIWVQDAWEWLWRMSMLLLLWPGGYGAQPERALVLMIVSLVGFWVVYHRYSLWMRSELIGVPSMIEPFRSVEAGLSRSARPDEKPKWAFDEAPKGFKHPPRTISELVEFWPSKKSWENGLTDDDRLDELQGPLIDAVHNCEENHTGDELSKLKALRKQLEHFGNTETAGFSRFDQGRMPTRFTHWLYSVDTMLPVIDLHAYGSYYPIWGPIRAVSAVQHVLGWWWVTVFIASAAIL